MTTNSAVADTKFQSHNLSAFVIPAFNEGAFVEDSGSGLVVLGHHNEPSLLVGLFSHEPLIFTQINSYLDWIENNTEH